MNALMSSERSRVILIFAAVAIVAAGGGYYFFKIYSPAQTKKAAQEEVGRWEERFSAARSCLLGPTPGSTKTSEALAIREMAPDPWDRGHCTPLMAKLSRGDEPDTGIKAVEAAWVDLDHAASRAAAAFATHIMSSTTLKEDPLPAALDQLDDARVALRTAAGMPAIAQSGKALRTAKIVPINDGELGLKELEVETKPSAHGMIVFGKSRANRDVQISLRTGTTPVVTVANGVLRSVPDPSWGAAVSPDGVNIGLYDDNGVMTAPQDQKLANGGVAAIVGSPSKGTVVFGSNKQLVVARITGDAKALTIKLDPPVESSGSQAAIDVDGRAAVVWRDAKQSHGRIFKAGPAGSPLDDEQTVELGDNPIGATCLTSDRAWVSTGTGVLAFGGGKPLVMRANPFYILMGCTTDSVVMRSLDATKPVLICTDDCRTVPIPKGAPELAAVTSVGGKLLALASHGGVLGVWREGMPSPEFFGLPEVADPVMAQEWPAMAMTDGKVIDVLARGAKGFVIIRVPAN